MTKTAPRPWLLSEINYGFVKHNPYQVAVLPMGATEPHNLHLPYGTDAFEAEAVGSMSCEKAWKQGAKVVMLPPMPYGTETNMMEFSMAMNLNPSTLTLVISDIVASLAKHNVMKLVVLNSHGGNDFKPVLRELADKTPVKIFLCEWYRGLSADAKEIFTNPDDHAGEMETSLIQFLKPHLVATDPVTGKLLADDGSVAKSRFDAINKGWVSITRPWHLLTTNSGSGNPHCATAEKGGKFLETVTDRFASFLVELSASPLDEKFPF